MILDFYRSFIVKLNNTSIKVKPGPRAANISVDNMMEKDYLHCFVEYNIFAWKKINPTNINTPISIISRDQSNDRDKNQVIQHKNLMPDMTSATPTLIYLSMKKTNYLFIIPNGQNNKIPHAILYFPTYI